MLKTPFPAKAQAPPSSWKSTPSMFSCFLLRFWSQKVPQMLKTLSLPSTFWAIIKCYFEPKTCHKCWRPPTHPFLPPLNPKDITNAQPSLPPWKFSRVYLTNNQAWFWIQNVSQIIKTLHPNPRQTRLQYRTFSPLIWPIVSDGPQKVCQKEQFLA